MKKTFILLAVMVGSFLTVPSFGQIIFQGLEPVAAQGFYGFTNPTWGANMLTPSNAVTGFGIIVDDGTTGDSLGCNPLVNSAAVSGKIAFIYRGTCEFGTKALKAQNAGAIAAVIINNESGTMAMGAGADGANVTIPVAMISKETGILLRPYLDAGTLKIFFGSKAGMFANDLGMQAKDVVRPLNFATPSLLAQDSSEFQVLVGANIRNFGSAAQSNVTLNAKILLNGTTEVYNENGSVASIASGDSALVDLPTFNLPNGNVAKYTITYTVSGANADEETSDNVIAQDFYITNGVYSKSRYDFTANTPIRTANYTSANSSKIKWGILLNAKKGSRVKANSVQFAASTSSPDVLTGELISAYLYEWDDANQDGGIATSELAEIAVGFYSYDSDLQNQYVTIPFADDPNNGPVLADDKVYYVALEYTGNKALFFPVDEGALDYQQTINYYSQSINPLLDIQTSSWYGGGFGSDLVLAVSLNTALNNASITESELNLKLAAYPNPANDVVNIAFGNALSNSTIKVDVIDVAGRTVLNKQFNVGAAQNYVTVNTADLSNGTYFFKVNVNGQAVKSIPVVVAK